MKGKQEVQDNQIKQKYNTLFLDENGKACNESKGEILIKRNKFGTFLNLLICILCFYCLLFLLDWGDIDMLVPPFEDIKETFLMYFLLIALTILSIIFSLQLTKKGQIIINEYGIIDKYSIFSKGDIYLWKDIRGIYYSWRGYRGFMKAIVLSLKSGKKVLFYQHLHGCEWMYEKFEIKLSIIVIFTRTMKYFFQISIITVSILIKKFIVIKKFII